MTQDQKIAMRDELVKAVMPGVLQSAANKVTLLNENLRGVVRQSHINHLVELAYDIAEAIVIQKMERDGG